PTEKTSNEKEGKIKNQVHAIEDLDDLTQPPETALQDSEETYLNFQNILGLIEEFKISHKDSFILLNIQDAVHSYQKIIELEGNDCLQCSAFVKNIARLKRKISGAKKELSELRTVTLELEQRRTVWKEQLYSLRCMLQEGEEKSKNYDQIYEHFKDQLRKEEEECNEQVEVTKQLEVSLRMLDTELRTTRNKLNQVSTNETERELLHEYVRLQDEIASMRLDIDTLKYQEEKEKKYLEDIEILREKHNALQSTVKLNEEIFIKTTLHYKEKIRLLKAELAMQNFNLENEEENTETLETEVSSCPVRLAAAPHHPDDSERAERDLGLVFQGARNEGFGSQAKEDFDTSSLTVGYELLPQQLSRSEMKIGSLENELHHTVDSFRKVTFDLIQTQGQIEKMEHSDQDEKSQGNKYTKTQEWIEKRFSQPQREYTLPQQKLRDLRNQVENEEDILTNIQGRFHHMVNMFQAQTENHNLKEENRNMELINECDEFRDELYPYENMEAEREEVSINQEEYMNYL
ncbi:Hypothetical predicted protein, partial [Marmota monax]